MEQSAAHLEAIRRHKQAAQQPKQPVQPEPKTPAPFLEGEYTGTANTVGQPEGITPPTVREQPMSLYTEEPDSERIKELRKAIVWSEILKRKF